MASPMVPVVLLHAFPLSSSMWQAQQDGLAGVSRVVCPDLPGAGETPLPTGEPSLDASADTVVALLDRLGVERAVLGGLSMGGYVAMAVARGHPQRLGGLLLVDTLATADPGPARDRRLRIAATLEEEGSTRVLLEEVLPTLTGETTRRERPEVQRRVRELVAAASPAGAAWSQRAMAARPESLSVLAGLDVPALVVVGDEDALTTVSDAQAMAEALPDASVVVLAGSGHLSALEVPELLTTAVRSWLGQRFPGG